MSLFGYMQQTQRLIKDQNQELINPSDLVDYVNRARREIAMRSQCVRFVPPVNGPVTSYTVTTGGTGYTAPTVTVSAPDSPGGTATNPLGLQATATATVVGGVITAVHVAVAGSGYFQPVVTITDATGTGAAVTANVAGIMQTVNGQEVYSFSAMAVPTGVKEVLAVRSISVIYANYRYSIPVSSFSSYQAYVRRYANQYSYVPQAGTQFGQGAAGSLYLYPVASQAYQLELDCSGYPADLLSDTDVEVLPDPWTQAVPYLAASFCYLELQNLNSAAFYRKMAEDNLGICRCAASPGRTINPYGSSR
jgi:hypothetical protein